MRKTLLLLLLSAVSALAIAIENEDYYNRLFCEEMQGEAEYVLEDLSRVDCLTDTHAFEADWADGLKVYESIGQALYYAAETGKLPGILLLIRKDNSEKHIRKVERVIKMYPDLKIQLIVRDVRADGVTASYSAVSTDLNDGLIAFYPFNGNAQDESGKGHHGRVDGATLTEDRFGNPDSAYSFDGIDDYIELPSMGTVDELTFVTWLNANTLSGWRAIRDDRGWSGGDIHYQFFNNKLEFSLLNNQPTDQWFDYYFSATKWHHIAITYSKSKKLLKLYVNGVFEQEKTYTWAISPILGQALIGGCDAGCDADPRPFDGTIDDFRIYNRVLSPDEVMALYNSRDIQSSLATSSDDSPTEVAEPAPVVERNFSNPQVDGFYIHPSTGAGIACYLLGCDGGYASSRITGQGRGMMWGAIWRGYELKAPQSNDDPYITGLTCFACQNTIETLTLKTINGNTDAMNELASLYNNLSNYEEAFKWWKQSAELGNRWARADLGHAYLRGEGTPQDLDQAEYWLTKAAEQGVDSAQRHLAEVYIRKGDTDNSQKAIEAMERKANNGNTDAMNELASLYNNMGNYDEAFKWWKQSAELGNRNAQDDLGRLYMWGQGVPANLGLAEYWLTKAVDAGNEWAANSLGELYVEAGSYPTALKWFNRALESSHAQLRVSAMTSIGRLYQKEGDTRKSVIWWQQAAELGDSSAQSELGYAYLNGNGISRDLELAKKWLTLAADQGNEWAQEGLDELKE